MRQIFNKTIVSGLLACTLLCGLFMTACSKDEVSADTELTIFGPSPALRGGELKFIGKNLDKVTAIVLKDNIQITEFTKKSADELIVVIPQDSKPGTVILKSPTGDITSKTPLSFTEPISIASVAPATAKAGDKLTITGDYLNLIKEVIFNDGVKVDSADFISQARKKIELTVPKEAKTGKIIVSNGAEIPVMVYSDASLAVTQPTISALAPAPVKAGTTLTISGTDFQLVKSIVFPGDLTVETFAVNTAKTSLTVTVPATAKEGKVQLVTYSGVKIESASAMTLVAPAVSSISPNPTKNGANLTITGTDLDLVTKVTFGGTVDGTISTQSATSLVVTVPLTALDGAITLGTNSGKTATTPALTLVKPTITSFSPTALMAGNDVTITGTDLDLVRKVTFVGGLTVDVNPTSATSLTVTVPPACVGNAVIGLTTTNGTVVNSTDQLSIEAANKPVITEIPTSIKPGAKMTIKGTKLNLVESIYFQDNVKAILYGVRTETSIEVYVPETAKKGTVTLTLKSFNGDEVVSPQFTISGTDPVVDPSYIFFDFDSKGSWWGSYGSVENNADLSLNGKYFRINQSLPSGWVDFFWRNSQNDMKVEGVTVAQWAVKMDVNVLGVTTPAFKFRLNGTDGDFWAIIPGLTNKGGWYTVTIPLTSFKDGNGYGTNTLPNVQNITKDFGLATAGEAGFVNICIDNIRFEKLSSPSSIMGLY